VIVCSVCNISNCGDCKDCHREVDNNEQKTIYKDGRMDGWLGLLSSYIMLEIV